MNATREPKNLSLEHELAPHVEQKWAQTFIFELRLKGVSGPTLGAALAEVDSHCAESGETATAAFGPPKEYAQSLDLPADSTSSGSGSMVRAVIPTGVQVIGFIAVIFAAPQYIPGGPVEISVGDVVLWGMLLAVIGLLIWRTQSLMRSAVDHPVISSVVVAGFFALMVVPLFLWPQTLVDVPVSVVLPLGLVLLVGGTIWEVVSINSRVSVDEIARPLEDGEAVVRRRRHARRLEYVRIFAFPIIGMLLTAVVLLRGW